MLFFGLKGFMLFVVLFLTEWVSESSRSERAGKRELVRKVVEQFGILQRILTVFEEK